MINQAEQWVEWLLEHPPTRPGYGGDPEPPRRISTGGASPEEIAQCLDCPVEGGCQRNNKKCPFCGKGKNAKGQQDKIAKRDSDIKYLIDSGWKNNDAICAELGISRGMLFRSKRRLRERGEIE